MFANFGKCIQKKMTIFLQFAYLFWNLSTEAAPQQMVWYSHTPRSASVLCRNRKREEKMAPVDK